VGYNMPEVPLRATVAARATSDMGRKLRLDVGRSSIVIMERPPLPIHPKFWRDVGLEARDADVVVQKNFFHYRIFYATTSFQHLPVVSDGATSFGRVRSRAYKTPVHPSAKIADWRAHDRELRL
jgi:hypothetical protein